MNEQRVVKDIIDLIELFGYIDGTHCSNYIYSLDLKDKGLREDGNEYENGYSMCAGECKRLLVEKFQYLLPKEYKFI